MEKRLPMLKSKALKAHNEEARVSGLKCFE